MAKTFVILFFLSCLFVNKLFEENECVSVTVYCNRILYYCQKTTKCS